MQFNDNAFLPRQCGVAAHHFRIMAWHDVLRAWRKRTQLIKTFQHFTDMKRCGEGPARFHVFVEMRDIRGQHHTPTRRIHAHALQAHGMAATGVHGNPRRHFRITIMEDHAFGEIHPYHADHILHLKGVAEFWVFHVAPGRILHFWFLQMEPRLGEFVEAADMIIMQVGNHHIFDLIRINAQQLQAFNWAAQVIALALGSDLRREAGINDHRAVFIHRSPNKVIHRHGRIMRVATDEMLRALGIAHGVTQRIDAVFGFIHAICSCITGCIPSAKPTMEASRKTDRKSPG